MEVSSGSSSSSPRTTNLSSNSGLSSRNSAFFNAENHKIRTFRSCFITKFGIRTLAKKGQIIKRQSENAFFVITHALLLGLRNAYSLQIMMLKSNASCGKKVPADGGCTGRSAHAAGLRPAEGGERQGQVRQRPEAAGADARHRPP